MMPLTLSLFDKTKRESFFKGTEVVAEELESRILHSGSPLALEAFEPAFDEFLESEISSQPIDFKSSDLFLEEVDDLPPQNVASRFGAAILTSWDNLTADEIAILKQYSVAESSERTLFDSPFELDEDEGIRDIVRENPVASPPANEGASHLWNHFESILNQPNPVQTEVPQFNLRIDASDRENCQVGFTLTGMNDGQLVAIQCRIGGEGAYINLPAHSVAEELRGGDSHFQISLPESADGRSDVELRILSAGATFGISDVCVFS